MFRSRSSARFGSACGLLPVLSVIDSSLDGASLRAVPHNGNGHRDGPLHIDLQRESAAQSERIPLGGKSGCNQCIPECRSGQWADACNLSKTAAETDAYRWRPQPGSLPRSSLATLLRCNPGQMKEI